MQVVQAFVGYTVRGWAIVFYRLLLLVTGGLLGVLGHQRPNLRKWVLQECPLDKADIVNVKVKWLHLLQLHCSCEA